MTTMQTRPTYTAVSTAFPAGCDEAKCGHKHRSVEAAVECAHATFRTTFSYTVEKSA